MLFLLGMFIGWFIGVFTVIVFVLCFATGRNREQSDIEQSEYLKKKQK